MNDAWVEAIERWALALRAAGRSAGTVSLRRHQVGRLARDLAPLGPWEVTGPDLVDWMGGQEWANETRRSHRSAARQFYEWAHARGHVEQDPALMLEPVKPGPPRPRPTPETVLRDALAIADERVRLALRLGSEAGLRRGEIVQVHRRDLLEDLGGWSLIVHGKGGRERIVPLTASLARAVRVACMATGGFAFPGQIDGHLSAGRMGKILSAVLPVGVTPHSLRHRFATRVYSHNQDVFVVQELLGHASPETTRRYVQVNGAALRAAVEAAA